MKQLSVRKSKLGSKNVLECESAVFLQEQATLMEGSAKCAGWSATWQKKFYLTSEPSHSKPSVVPKDRPFVLFVQGALWPGGAASGALIG